MSKDGNKKEKSDYRIGISGIIPCKQDDYVCVANKLQSKEGSKSVEEFASFLKNEISKELSTKPELKKKFPTTSRVFIWIIQFLKDKNKSCQGDIDNMARTILNSLEGVIYKDDKQVSELYVCKQENFNRLNDNFIYI